MQGGERPLGSRSDIEIAGQRISPRQSAVRQPSIITNPTERRDGARGALDELQH
jgi:hypothetical protein